ncbi:heavy metal translocating P-type ATPase [Lagierella massiliensis]|uniref:heavy metal translocating P-type ATPase n=1 Tax=Lagierella massiliensis TaxID=1689303 RepID=UPI0006D76567|nr:heavy metal translocating P-type ATPase [Lagierella massiliensis]
MEVKLDGLKCANCGAKIEREINNLPNVKFANVNVIDSTLNIETEDGNYEQTLKECKKIVDRIEPGTGFRVVDEMEEVEEEEPESKKKIISMAISALLMVIAYLIKEKNSTLNLILEISAYLVVGLPILKTAFINITKGQIFDENFLMTIATLGAIAIGQREEGVMVMLLYTLGEYLQDKAVDSSTKSIKNLVKMKPESANLVSDGKTEVVKPEVLKIGDIIRILPGEKIPVDSIVIKGETSLDTSSITGESMPVNVSIGDEIISGSINNEGVIEAKVRKEYKDSAVSQILDLVKNASNKKSETENFITVFARYYTPIVVIAAVVIAVLPPIILKEEFIKWIYTALTFLVISCPCAMIISIPLAYFASIGVSSKHGILVKGSNYVESMSKVDTIIMDKTGTITEGSFKVTDVVAKSCTEEELLSIAKKMEEHSNHPIALSIRNYYKDEVNLDIKNIKDIPGKGLSGELEGEKILLGNSKLLKENKILVEEVESSGTMIYVAKNGEFLGHIEIADSIKKDARETIKELKEQGIKNIIMLTGDREISASEVAKKLKLDGYRAGLLPQDKVKSFNEIKESAEGRVAFVGDGVNDAPVLRISDVGIVMGELGSDAAIESGDVTLMGNGLKKLSLFHRISKKTKLISMENIVFALGVKFIVMILGVMGHANMWAAVFADVGVSLIAVFNSLRIMFIKKN